MDFVVSKVVMSICALMVVSILGGMFAPGTLYDSDGELEMVLRDFCSAADFVALSAAEANMAWIVPFTSSGGIIQFELNKSIVYVECGTDKAVGQPVCDLRTWDISSSALNSTELDLLEDHSPSITAQSGDSIELTSSKILLDGETATIVFATLKP